MKTSLFFFFSDHFSLFIFLVQYLNKSLRCWKAFDSLLESLGILKVSGVSSIRSSNTVKQYGVSKAF